jgi:hypothetical protein
MTLRFLTILTGRNLAEGIWQPREPEPSIVNEKTIADFTRVVEQRGFWTASRWRMRAPGAPLRELSETILASLRNHAGKGVQQVNEGSPARWRLKEAAN